MLLSMTDNEPSSRIRKLRSAVSQARPGICPERALLWTRYYRQRANRAKPVPIQMAEALAFVLAEKKIRIYDHELIVGNYTGKRVGGSIYPELHGVPVLLDIFKFPGRKTNPLEISRQEMAQLLSIIPFWMFRFMALRAFKSPLKKLSFVLDQLTAHYYLINECGGISHLAPDYAFLIRHGTAGILRKAKAKQRLCKEGSSEWIFYQAVQIAAKGLARFGRRYALLARDAAEQERDVQRREELLRIAQVCTHVPEQGARTFHEALQSLFFAQIAVNLESLDNAVCPGRMDQYLWPYYLQDVEAGLLDREQARELLACFCIKLCEIVPVFSEHLTRFHGGMFNGQVITVGGVDSQGNDATNELSMLLLEVIDQLRMRQPNFHARVHRHAPEHYLQAIVRGLSTGSNTPALYNDEVIIPTMIRHGYSPAHARDYTAVGCVEPVSQGRSFASTDAALFNVPVVLELALNQGRRFGCSPQVGVRTCPPHAMHSMEQVKEAFERQLSFMLARLVADLQAIEVANARFHPTPLTSMLLAGPLEQGRCSTRGGAQYNFSGIQAVGLAEVGDSLYAIWHTVFREHRLDMAQLVHQLSNNFPDRKLLSHLKGLDKFGNDNPEVDQWTAYALDCFVSALSAWTNTRGGAYVAGLYSVTAHEYFGRITGALPSGRSQGEPFGAGVGPALGADRLGPTALINSVTRLDFSKVANGVNFNLKFDQRTIGGRVGELALLSLLKTCFQKGGMQVQVNVLDAEVLREAREHPERYPHLLVRVSGYSAYFSDLTPGLQEEIIRRTEHGLAS